MDRLYGLPSKLRDHLHQRATTFESSLSSQVSRYPSLEHVVGN